MCQAVMQADEAESRNGKRIARLCKELANEKPLDVRYAAEVEDAFLGPAPARPGATAKLMADIHKAKSLPEVDVEIELEGIMFPATVQFQWETWADDDGLFDAATTGNSMTGSRRTRRVAVAQGIYFKDPAEVCRILAAEFPLYDAPEIEKAMSKQREE